MKTLILMVMSLVAPVLAQPTSGKPGSYTLLGSLGQSYLIRMELERSGDVFRGSYRYERPGVVRPGSNSIGLTGSIDSGGNLQLIETAEVSGRPGSPGRLGVVRTGEFNGRLITTTANGQSLLHLAGTWTRSRDGRRMPFSLDQLRLNFGNDQLTSREEKEEQKPLNYGVRLNLPVLGGPESKFNRHLAAIVNPLAADFRKDVADLRKDEQGLRSEMPASSLDVDYAIVSATPELISLQLTIYSYTGGAHPNGRTRSFNWDPRSESEIQLADLFTPGSAYGRIIADYCRRELARLDIGDREWLARGTAFDEENYQRWNPTRAGLRITFDPYQVAAYAQGAFEVTVPWGTLKTLLRPSFGQIVQAGK